MFDITVIFDWLERLFASYGYWLIPLGTFLESMVLISLAAPGLVILLLAGYYAAQGVLSLPFVVFLGLLGAIIGDNTSYIIGRSIWTRYSGKFSFGRRLDVISQPLVNRTIWFLPFYHFSGYGRALVPLASGALKIPFKRWIKYDSIGAIAWSVSFSLLGYWAGSYGNTVEAVFGKSDLIEWIFSAIFLIWVVVAGLTLWRMTRKFVRDKNNDKS